jgi:hypothetical protein
MAKKAAVCPTHKDNKKRSEAKFKRGFGKLAMKKAGMDQVQWTKKFDPLFEIGGIIRHRRLHQL